MCSAIYALGSLCENEDVKAKIVEFGAIRPVVRQCISGDIEIKRAAGYFLANICEQVSLFVLVYTIFSLFCFVYPAKSLSLWIFICLFVCIIYFL